MKELVKIILIIANKCVCAPASWIENKISNCSGTSVKNSFHGSLDRENENVLFTSKVGNGATLLQKRSPVPLGAISGSLDKAAGATKFPGVILVEASAELILGVDNLLGTLALPAKVLL